jgi:hypothetical protein
MTTDVKTMGLLPEYATTAIRGAARKPRKAAAIILKYALANGPRIDMTEKSADVHALDELGLGRARIPNAISDLQKYYGVKVTTERAGRVVITYVLELEGTAT